MGVLKKAAVSGGLRCSGLVEQQIIRAVGFEFGDVVLFFGEPYIRMFQYLR